MKREGIEELAGHMCEEETSSCHIHLFSDGSILENV